MTSVDLLMYFYKQNISQDSSIDRRLLRGLLETQVPSGVFYEQKIPLGIVYECSGDYYGWIGWIEAPPRSSMDVSEDFSRPKTLPESSTIKRCHGFLQWTKYISKDFYRQKSDQGSSTNSRPFNGIL